jgi:hypothetical protein
VAAKALLRRDSQDAEKRRRRLSAAAQLVADHLVCPCCLIAHHLQLLDALWAQQSAHAEGMTKLMSVFSERTGAGGWRECQLKSKTEKVTEGQLKSNADEVWVTCRVAIEGTE